MITKQSFETITEQGEIAILNFEQVRNATFSEEVSFTNIDLTGQSLACHLKDYPDAPGEPSLELTVSSPLVETMTWDEATAAFGSVRPDDEDGSKIITISTVTLSATMADLQDLPVNPVQRGIPAAFFIDFQAQGTSTYVLFRGVFTLIGGGTYNGQ